MYDINEDQESTFDEIFNSLFGPKSRFSKYSTEQALIQADEQIKFIMSYDKQSLQQRFGNQYGKFKLELSNLNKDLSDVLAQLDYIKDTFFKSSND